RKSNVRISACSRAVSNRHTQAKPAPAAGTLNSTGASAAFSKSNKRWAVLLRLPSKTPTVRRLTSCQSFWDLSPPLMCNQLTSLTPVREAVPLRNVSRRSSACCCLSFVSRRTNWTRSWLALQSDQSTQDVSLSWQYALLLPFWVRANSSPACSMGTPCDRTNVASMFRICRLRKALTAASWVAPSTPQFQLRLLLVPSV